MIRWLLFIGICKIDTIVSWIILSQISKNVQLDSTHTDCSLSGYVSVINMWGWKEGGSLPRQNVGKGASYPLRWKQGHDLCIGIRNICWQWIQLHRPTNSWANNNDFIHQGLQYLM